MSLQKNLANAMKAFKASRHLSISDFSEELGISCSSMQTLLKGSGNPRMDTIEHIAAQLEIEPHVLLSVSFSESQLEFAMHILDSLDFFSKLSTAEREAFASLFLKMLLMID